MDADPLGPDPKSLWRDQEREADPVTLEQIHALVRRYDNKARWRGVVLALALVVVGAAGSAAWSRAHDPVLAVLFFGGEFATCYMAYRVAFPNRDPAEPAGAYLRRRLQVRLDYLHGGWMWVAAPLLPCVLWGGYVASQLHTLPLSRRLAPFVGMAVCVVFVSIWSRVRARKIKAHLDELDGLFERQAEP
jgi:hypothetical protein